MSKIKRILFLFIIVGMIFFTVACEEKIIEPSFKDIKIYQSSNTNTNTDDEKDKTLSSNNVELNNSELKNKVNDLFKESIEINYDFSVDPNSEFKLLIRLINPNHQVITSVTMSNRTYFREDFDKLSTDESIIIKMNAGEISGVFSYEVTNITYIDLETIEEKEIIVNKNNILKLAV